MTTNEEGIIRVKNVPAQSNTLSGVATALGGTALLGVAGQAIGNTFSRYLGNIGNNIGALSGGAIIPAAAPFAAPMYNQAVYEGGYVTKEMAQLMAENGQLKAEKYADGLDKEARKEFYAVIGTTNNRVCDLEKEAEVNAVKLSGYKRFADSEFVHQPKVKFDRRKIKTYDDDCCDHHHDHC